MKAHWIYGLGIALVGSIMGISNAHAEPYPTPSIPCNESNMFTETSVNYYDQRVRRNVIITYWCDGLQWHAYMICDPKRQPSCEIIIT